MASRLRSAYEVSPGIKPFVEVGGDRRVHDQINCFCEDRNSDGRTIKGGVQFELTRKLTGEFSVGTLTRDYKDPGLETLRGTLVDASLIYYATPLTTLKFDAKTTRRRIQHPGRLRHADARLHPAGRSQFPALADRHAQGRLRH